MDQFIKIESDHIVGQLRPQGGSRNLLICPKVAKVGSIIGHRIDYNGVGALRGQRHIPSKN